MNQTDPFPFERDPVIEFYKKDVDVTLLDENLKLTVDQRLRNYQNFMLAVDELRNGMIKAKASNEQR